MNYFQKKKNYYSIFLFHGVIKKNKFSVRNYNSKHITEKKFLKNLKFLKQKGHALSLDEIIFSKKNRIDLPKNSFVITFDDGFENNYSTAAPILHDLRIPATFYFSTDFVENQTLSWIDEVEIMIQFTKKKFIINPISNKFENISTTINKINFLKNLRKIVKKNHKLNVKNLTKNIKKFSLIDPNKYKNKVLDKKISWQQIKELNNNDLFTIGGHSHEHLSLASLDFINAKHQIEKSFKLFKKKAKLDLIHYSYPEGQKIDYNIKIINFLKKKGIICCPSAIKGHNHLTLNNLFNLKRIMI